MKLTDATWNDETIAQLLGIATQYSCYRQREDSIIRENTVFYASQAKPLSNAKLESDLLLFTGIFQSYRRTNFVSLYNILSILIYFCRELCLMWMLVSLLHWEHIIW